MLVNGKNLFGVLIATMFRFFLFSCFLNCFLCFLPLLLVELDDDSFYFIFNVCCSLGTSKVEKLYASYFNVYLYIYFYVHTPFAHLPHEMGV